MMGMPGMPGVMGLMGQLQSGEPIALPPLDVPCGVCTLRSADEAAARLAEAPAPARAVTLIAGTPVCTPHGRELLAAIVGTGE